MALLTLSWGLDVALVLFLPALVAACVYMNRNLNHWTRKGVIEIPPIPFFGNFLDCCLFRVSPSEFLGSLYKRGKNLPFVGFYIFDQPALLLRDPKVIKNVLVKDFDSFLNRYTTTHQSDTVGSANLLLLKNAAWKIARGKLTSMFTAAKMKKIYFQLMSEIGKDLVTHLDNLKLQDEGRAVEVKDVTVKYTTDAISSCAFGLQVNSLNDPDSAFNKCAKSIFGFATYRRCAEITAFFFVPPIVKLLNLRFFSEEASDFMRNIFTETMNLRMENNIRRNDLIDMLIELKTSGKEAPDSDNFKFDGDNLVGQAATFFAAGFETSSTTMAFSLYELALHVNIQTKLREEMISALAETGGKITYEMVMNLPYLDKVVSETLRKYPPLPFLDRIAVRDYQIPGTDLVIEEGTPIDIPLLGLHYDPEYFPDPETYDPERFSGENKRSRPSYVYLPFGDGPRVCIGLRFGMLLAKLGVFNVILNYEVTACEETMIPVRYDPKSISVTPLGGLFLNIRRIK